MNTQNHSTTIEFYAGVGGEVTPSCHVIKHYNKRIMTDCGITPGVSVAPQIPENVDYVVLTHPHVDHIGWLLHFWMKNKCPTFIPEGSKHAITTALRWTYKIQSQQGEMASRFQAVTQWLQDAKEWLNDFYYLLMRENHKSHSKMNRTGRTEQSIPHNLKKQIIEADEREHAGRVESAHLHLQNILWLQGYNLENIEDIKELGRTVKLDWVQPKNKKKSHEVEHAYRKEVLTEIINLSYRSRMLRLAEEAIITPDDVEACIDNLKELTLWKFHKIFAGWEWKERDQKKSIEIRFQNSGHVYSATSAQALYRLGGKGGKHILATGDLGNDNLPHPYPKIDRAGLTGIADAVITEGTYGGTNHPDREKELDKFDRIIVDAIRSGKDIVMPIISLDRPIFGMWEIVTRLFEKGSAIGKEAKIKPEDVECLYLWNDLESFLPKRTEVWKKIQRYMKPLDPDRVQSLGKKGKKSRIILAGGWFLPPKSPAAGVLVHALKRNSTQVLFINYCGADDSNARRLLARKPFTAFEKNRMGETEHELELSWNQGGHVVSAFSGHADQQTIVEHVLGASKKGAKILINHASDEAAKKLKRALQSTSGYGVNVILPRLRQVFAVKKIPVEK
jgi:Cft2 family RNA processing exonuclease